MSAYLVLGGLSAGSLLMFVGMVIAASSRNVEEKRRSIGLGVALVGTMVMLVAVVFLAIQTLM